MSAGSRSGECGGDFGGMVPVVVNYGLAGRFMNDFEAALGPTEALECADDGVEGLSDFAGQRNCGEGVYRIVGPRDVQHDFAECLSVLADAEARFEVFCSEVCDAVARLGPESVGNGMGV